MRFYIIFSLLSSGVVFYRQLLFGNISFSNIGSGVEYFNLIGAYLIAFSAGLYVLDKLKVSSILAIVGLSLISRSILIHLFQLDVLTSEFMQINRFNLLLICTIPPLILGYAFYLAIRVNLGLNNYNASLSRLSPIVKLTLVFLPSVILSFVISYVYVG